LKSANESPLQEEEICLLCVEVGEDRHILNSFGKLDHDKGFPLQNFKNFGKEF
jgi:hypothetical protein